MNKPTELEPLEFKCTSCRGEGCDRCSNGWVIVTDCPIKSIDDTAAQAMRFAGYARDGGLWPVAGGALDQSPAFMEAEQQIRQDRAYWNAKLGLAD